MSIHAKLVEILASEKKSSYRYSITSELLSRLYYEILVNKNELVAMRPQDFVGVVHLIMACCDDFHKGRVPKDQMKCFERCIESCPQLMERDALWAAARTSSSFAGEMDLLEWAFALPPEHAKRQQWINCFAIRAVTYAPRTFTEWLDSQAIDAVELILQAFPIEHLAAFVGCFRTIYNIQKHRDAFFDYFNRMDLDILLDVIWPLVVEHGLQRLSNKINRGYTYGIATTCGLLYELWWMWVAENAYQKRSEANSHCSRIVGRIRQASVVVEGPIALWSRLVDDGDMVTANVFRFTASVVWGHLMGIIKEEAKLARQATAAVDCIHEPASSLVPDRSCLHAFARLWPHLTADARDRVWTMWDWDKAQYSHWQVIEALVVELMPLAPSPATQHALALANRVSIKKLPPSGTLGYGDASITLVRATLMRASGTSCPLPLDCLDVAHAILETNFSVSFQGVTRFHAGDCEALVRGASEYERQMAALARQTVANREPGQVTQRRDPEAITSLNAVMRLCTIQEQLDHLLQGTRDFLPQCVTVVRKHLLVTATKTHLMPLLCHVTDLVNLCTSYLF